MLYLPTQSRFKLCMQLADSVQYVIDVLVREKMLPYLCLWRLDVNFYREEKKHVLGLANQKNGNLKHDESCCDFKIPELTFVLFEIFVEYVCCMF